MTETNNDETTQLAQQQQIILQTEQVIKDDTNNQTQSTSTPSSAPSFAVPQQDHNDNDNNNDNINDYPIVENSMVEVLPRTWPGVNKIGGIARVTKCHYHHDDSPHSSTSTARRSDEKPTHVDVRYVVMGGREKMVPMEYCKPAPQYDHRKQSMILLYHHQQQEQQQQNRSGNMSGSNTSDNHGCLTNVAWGDGYPKRMRLNLRDRSSLLGRCKLCGSLRSDCGSCDWVAEEKKRLQQINEQQVQEEMENVVHVHESDNVRRSSDTQYRKRKRTMTRRRQSNKLDGASLKFNKNYLKEEEEEEDGNVGSIGDDDDSLSFHGSNHSNDDQDHDDDDDDDESYTLYNRRSLRNKMIHTFSSSSSSESNASSSSDDSSSNDDDDDDQILANLNQIISSANWKRMKQRVKQIAKLSYGGEMKKRRKRLKRRYMQSSDVKFRARMKFLNQHLEKRNVSSSRQHGQQQQQQQQQQQPRDERRSRTNQPSVLEKIGEPRKQVQRKDIPIPSFYVPLLVEHDTELASQESMEKDAVDDNVSNSASALNHDKALKIGFVDGNDIGEQESDEDNKIHEENEEISSMENDAKRYARSKFSKDHRMDAIRGYYEDDGLGMNAFIQPEGELVADSLPSDVMDRSKDVPFSELPAFCNNVLDDLTKVHVPKYEAWVIGMEKEFDTIYSRLQRGKGSMDDGNLFKIQKQCRELYDEMCVVLVRDGTDQCRCALKRFGKKKEYRMATTDRLPKKVWKDLVENLDLKFDAVDDEVESLLQRARSILLECSDEIDFYSENNKDQTCDAISSYNRNHREIQGKNDVDSSSRSNHKHQHASRSKRSLYETLHLHSRSKSEAKQRKERGRRIRNESNTHRYESSQRVTNSSNSSYRNSFADDQGIRVRRDRYRSQIRKVGDINKCFHNKAPIRKRLYSEYEGELNGSTPKSYLDDSLQGTDHGSHIADDQQLIAISCEDLYEELNRSLLTESVNLLPSGSNLPSMNDLMKYCETLSDAYPAESCCHLLEVLPLYFDQPHLSADNLHGAAVTVFNTLLSLLGKFAGHSFQEMIAMKSQDIVSHLKVFCCVFSLRRRLAHRHLKSSDAVIYKVFVGRELQNCVIVQMIDVLYALFLPKQWGTPTTISNTAYSLLCELRDEMRYSTHLTEDFSNAVIKFPCQTWRKTNMKAIAEQSWYVSSVDSTDLEIILRGDTPLGGNKISRLSLMKKHCPRREINAIWGMFAWFSRRSTSPNVNATVRWRLLSSLFTYPAGSLSHYAGATHPFPPSPSQLKCLQDEFKRVEILLRSGGMEPLPNDDGILGGVLFRALLLYGESEHCTDVRKVRKPTSQRDSRLAFDVWKESDISYLIGKQSAPLNFVSRRLLTECFGLTNDDSSQFSLSLSDESTLCTVLNFLQEWLNRITKKKARWSRLGDILAKVADKLLNFSSHVKADSDQLRNDQKGGIEAAFSSVFSNVGADTTDDDSDGVGLKCVLTNAIAHMFVLVIESLSKSGIEVETNFPIKLDLSFCTKVWTSIADRPMQQRQSHLMAKCSLVQRNKNHTSSIKKIYMAMKTVSLVLLSILDEAKYKVRIEVDSCDEDIKSTTESRIAFMLTCMLTLVSCACDHLTASTRKLLPGPMVSIECNSERFLDINVMACGLLWLSCIVHKMTFILHKNQSINFLALRVLKDASNHFSSRAFNVILECLKAIPSCAVEKSSSGTCYRLCLSLLRNTINLYWVCHKVHTMRAETSSCEKELINLTPSDSQISTHDQELYGGIDDDMLMSIDLGRLVNAEKNLQIEESKHVDADCYGAKDIWNILVETLDNAKPSKRFKIEQTVTPLATEFTHQGKVVCALHAAAICGVISSFCAVREANDATRDDVNSVIELRLWQNSSSTSVENDNDFFHDIRRCICTELCNIAKYSTNCTELIGGLSGGIILRTFINSAVNASTLNIFPSTNKKVLVEIGGKDSSVEEHLLLKALEELQNHNSIDIDCEYLVNQRPSDYFDTPGPTYMASHFWSFCSDLGTLLQSTYKDVSLTHEGLVLNRVGTALITTDYDLDPAMKTILSEALESMPKFSLERECFRRIMTLRSITSACFAGESVASLTDSHKPKYQHRMLDLDISATLISSLIEELSNLITGVEYYEKNPLSVEPHTKAKIHVLFHAYSHFISSFLTWLLSQSSTIQVKDLFDVLLRYFLLPVLRCKGFNNGKEVFRAAGMMMKGNASKKFQSGAPSYGTRNQISSKILLFSLTRYMDRIVDYACLSEEDHNLYQIMTCFEASNPETLQKNTFIPISFVESIERRFSKDEVNLVGSIDFYFSLVRANYDQTTTRAKTSIKRFRIFAVRSFLLPKLKHEFVRSESKVNLLLTLLHILDIKSIEKKYDIPKPLYISTEDDDEDFFLNMDLDVAEILSGIFINLNRSFIVKNVNSPIIKYSYKCVRCLLTMRVTGGINYSLMAWCAANQEENHIASKIQDYMTAFFLLSRILTSHQLNFIVEHYETMNFQRNNTSNLFEKYKDMVSSVIPNDHPDLDRFPNPQNHYIAQNSALKPASSTTDQSIDDETREVLVSFQSYFATSE